MRKLINFLRLFDKIPIWQGGGPNFNLLVFEW